ncbi:MAG: hypothetical protein R8K48_07815 [Gallionella sp.]
MMNSVTRGKNDDTWSTLFSLLVSNGSTPPPLASAINSIVPSSQVTGLSPTGRNRALADPESAYKMMSVINHVEVLYQAQSSELSQMKTAVQQMEGAGKTLATVDHSMTNSSIKLKLLGFVGQYNNWIHRFNPDVQQGGLLAHTQAAQVSQYELEQSVKSRFFGAGEGVNGMAVLGLTIDPHSKLARLDTAKLDAVLASNKSGAVVAVEEFSANFTKSARLLVAEGGFISKQLNNLGHAIHYISVNKDALQQEFGTGDAATPTRQVAAYKSGAKA